MRDSPVSSDGIPSCETITEIRGLLVSWYSESGRTFPWRNPGASEYERIIAEFLLQRTRASTVASHLAAVLVSAPDWHYLAQIPQDRLESLLRPFGLWRNRARTLHALADRMVSQRGRVPKTLDEVAQLPGAGQYLARAMLLIAYGVPGALLDSNMARVLERRFGPRQLSDIRYDPRLQAVASAMTACDRSLDVNFAILDLAADVCKSNKPICSVCPIRCGCPYPNIRGMVLK